MGGARQILSSRTKPHTFGSRFFPQQSGLLWRHPKVWVSVSSGWSGSPKAEGLFIQLFLFDLSVGKNQRQFLNGRGLGLLGGFLQATVAGLFDG